MKVILQETKYGMSPYDHYYTNVGNQAQAMGVDPDLLLQQYNRMCYDAASLGEEYVRQISNENIMHYGCGFAGIVVESCGWDGPYYFGVEAPPAVLPYPGGGGDGDDDDGGAWDKDPDVHYMPYTIFRAVLRAVFIHPNHRSIVTISYDVNKREYRAFCRPPRPEKHHSDDAKSTVSDAGSSSRRRKKYHGGRRGRSNKQQEYRFEEPGGFGSHGIGASL
jgi:hypothetical protein